MVCNMCAIENFFFELGFWIFVAFGVLYFVLFCLPDSETKCTQIIQLHNTEKLIHYNIQESDNSAHIRNRQDVINNIFPIKARYIRLWINCKVSAVCEVEVYNTQMTYPKEEIFQVLKTILKIDGIAKIIDEYICCESLEDVTQDAKFVQFAAK